VIIILKEQLFYIVVNIFIIRFVDLSYAKHLLVIYYTQFIIYSFETWTMLL